MDIKNSNKEVQVGILCATNVELFIQGDYSFSGKKVEGKQFITIEKTAKEIGLTHASEKGIVHSILFRGNNFEVIVKVGELLLTGYRSLEHEPLVEGEEVFVLIHRLYIFDETDSRMVENRLKIDPMPIYI